MDQYCGIGGLNSVGQWPIPNCGGPMCHHGPGPGPSGQGPGSGGFIGPGPLAQHGPPLPPPICNPFISNNFNSVPLPGPSRWGPRSSCPVHSPFRVRAPNGSVCSGHQVIRMRTEPFLNLFFFSVASLH